MHMSSEDPSTGVEVEGLFLVYKGVKKLMWNRPGWVLNTRYLMGGESTPESVMKMLRCVKEFPYAEAEATGS
jgi:hypothetical protein